MARRSRKSGFDDGVELIARLPWHVCLVLAVGSWFGFHELSQISLPKPTSVNELGAAYSPMILRTLGMVMQVIAPAACVFAAVTSWWRKRRRTQLLAESEARKTTATNAISERSLIYGGVVPGPKANRAAVHDFVIRFTTLIDGNKPVFPTFKVVN